MTRCTACFMIRMESIRVVSEAREMRLLEGQPLIRYYEMDAATERLDMHDSPSHGACHTKERYSDTVTKLDVQDMEARTSAISG